MIFVFNVLFSSLVHVSDLSKCLFLNDEPYVVIPTNIDMNPVELKHYPFMISLNKYAWSCNVLSTIIWVPKETKDINFKAFNMITNQRKLSCNSNKRWNNKICRCECKNYPECEKDYSWNPTACICEK